MAENERRSLLVTTLEKWNETTSVINSEWFQKVLKNSASKKKAPPDTRIKDFISKMRELRIETYGTLTEECVNDVFDPDEEINQMRAHMDQKEQFAQMIISDLREKNEVLTQQNGELDRQIESLEKQNEENQKQIDEFVFKQLEQDNAIITYQRQISQLTQKLEEFERIRTLELPLSPISLSSSDEEGPSRIIKKQKRVRFQDPLLNNEDIVFDTNWDNLTDELKLKCISILDFKSRISLRSTSRSMRTLVDSQRFLFDEVHLFSKHNLITTWKDSECTNYKLSSSPNTIYSNQEIERISSLISLIVYILKTCNIKVFRVTELSGIDQSLLRDIDKIIEEHTIRIKNFHAQKFQMTTEFFLKKCWNRMDSVMIEDRDMQLENLISIPAVDSANCLHIFCDDYQRQFVFLMEHFIKKDGPIGSMIKIQCKNHELLNEWLEYCQAMILAYKEDNQWLMSTFNDEKQATITYGSDNLLEIIIVPIQSVPPSQL